jgi:D-3-phosphoglycerate dehydrogenase / 2-oxoglutarate reductase
MKILIATEKPFAPIAVRQIKEVIEAAGHLPVFLENYKTVGEFQEAVSDANGLIVRSDKVNHTILDAALQLRIIVRAGAGYDNLDLQACNDHNIVAMNTPGQNSNAVAELVFELMLYQIRRGFSGQTGSELRLKTFGIHAFGNVGKYVADIARGFGMDTYAYDPFVSERVMKNNNAKQCTHIEDLYSKCRYISIHLPSNERTNKIIGYDLLKLMPANAVLVNTARKELIDENGLLRIFDERKDFSYLTDIAPDCKNIFEEKYKGRFIFTEKKMGAQTEESNINSGVAAARQIVDYFKTGNEKYRVNKQL